MCASNCHYIMIEAKGKANVIVRMAMQRQYEYNEKKKLLPLRPILIW